MLPYVDKIEFELLPRPTNGEDGKPLLYVRPVPAMKCDLNYIDDFCARYRGTQAGDIKRLFETFIDAAGFMLSSGMRVETPVGSFAIKLRLDGDFTDPEKVKPDHVSYAGLEFIPSKRFLQEADPTRQHHGFRKLDTQVGNAQMYDPQAMEEALRRSLYHGYITVRTFQVFSGLKYKSARRYLDSLCEGPTPRLHRDKDAGVLHYFPVAAPEADR